MLQQPTKAASLSQTTTEAEAPVLHLRPGTAEKKTKTKKPKVRWTEDVVDNEHMDKKKSKICCIFHPQKEFGESSDSDSLSGSSDSSGDEKEDKHKHTHECRKKAGPNAYEKQPRYKNLSTVPENAQ